MTVLRDDLDCCDVVEMVTDHLEAALDAVTTARLERHLALCPGCRRYLAQIQRIAAMLGALRSDAVSSRMRAALTETIRGFRR